MKALKNAALLFLITFLACAVSNWGNELTKNPVVVCAGLFSSAIIYAFADSFLD